jgi:PAS domain S-box-containing protein
MLGKPLTRIMPKRFHEAHKNSLNRVASGGKPRIVGKTVEVIGLRRDKSEFPLELSMAKWKTGEGVFFTAVIRDIAERKQAEESLRESESRLKLAIEALESGIWELNVKTGKAWRSLRHDQIFGYTTLLPEWTYQMFLDHVIPEDRSEVDGKYGYALSTKTEWDFECRIRRVDKTVRWIWAHGNPSEYDDKNEVVTITGIVRDITERKQAEETLKDSEEKFRSLVESTSDWIWEINRNGVYTYASPKIKELLGYEPEEVIGKTPFDLMPAEETNRVASKFKDIIKNSKPIERLENICLHKDGHPVTLETSGVPIFNSKGQLRGYRGVDRDITERKRAEEALRERWKELTCLYGIGVEIQKDLPVGDPCRRVSEHLVTAMQFPDITVVVIELDSKRFASKKHTEGLSHGLQAEIRVGGNVRGHLWVYYTEQKPFIIPHEQNLVTGIAQTLGLWLERKQAKEALQQSQESYQNLVENINDVIFEVDTEGNIIYISPAIERIGKYKADELIGQNFSRFVHPDDMPGLISSFQHVFAGILKPFEFRVLDKDGSIRYARTNSRQKIQRGQIIGITGVLSDITEQKKMLDSLTITDRLAALGNMAGGFAHELNNPLTGVIGYTQLLLDRKDLPEDVRRDLTGIYEEAQRAAEVIKNFMVFALKRPLQKQLSDINSFIKDVLKLRQYEQKNTNIKVKTNFDPELPLVMAGPSRMRQVFMDIITNAEYFMFEAHKKGTLTITTESKGDVITASFTDDGPGIPPENLGQIFNPFFTTKEVGQGIGLGLSICHSIVTEHGGNIYVESEPGKGATFIVELPITKD